MQSRKIIAASVAGLAALLASSSAVFASVAGVAYRGSSEEDRELLDLRVITGLSAEEVGVLLDRNAGAVRMAQSRALARLRTQFKLVYR